MAELTDIEIEQALAAYGGKYADTLAMRACRALKASRADHETTMAFYVSKGEEPCVWCGQMSKVMTDIEYQIALRNGGSKP